MCVLSVSDVILSPLTTHTHVFDGEEEEKPRFLTAKSAPHLNASHRAK